MKKIMLALTIMLMLTACVPSQPAAPTPYPTYTPYPTHTPYPTYTVEPTCTPMVITKVVTSTNTPSPTLTPTPLYTATATATAVPLSSYITDMDQITTYLNDPDGSFGKTIKILLEATSTIYINGTEKTIVHAAVFPKEQQLYYLLAREDKLSDETVDLQNTPFSWAYGVIIGTVKYSYVEESQYFTPQYFTMAKVRIVHQEPIDQLKHPKGDGLYMVNTDIAPGQWYSSYPMTEDGCYWARINSSGNIIDNHYGVAGITVYVAPTDTVVEFDGCGTMYYIDNN